MSTVAPTPNEDTLDELIDAYLDRSLTDHQHESLCAMLRADDQNAREFARRSVMHRRLRELMEMDQNRLRLASIEDEAEVQDLLHKIEPPPEDALPRDLIDAYKAVFNQERKQSSDAIGLGTALSDLRWAAGKAARRLIVSKPAILAGIAALLLIGLYLFGPFGGGEDPAPEFVDKPDETTSTAQIVATLTAERDAVWDNQPGKNLYAGHQFELKKGFAEITTRRGAVAVLEAPASVEFFDHDNAIRLRSGKLVGLCESESSKGFVVKTANANIVDLGTEFGVFIDPQGMLHTQVFDGSVAITPNAQNTDARPTTLIAGEASRVDREGTITEVLPDALAFAGLLDSDLLHHRRASYDNWLKYSESLRRDPAIVAYYGFTADDERQNKLQNLAYATADSLHGLMPAESRNAPSWDRGRFPQKRALRFDRSIPQWVRVPHDERLNPGEAITIACWINRAGEGEQGGIFVCKSENRDLISYQLGGFDGKSTPHSKKIQFVTSKVHQGARESTARVLEATDRWEHFAVVYDSKIVRFYHNGEPAGTAPMTLSMPATSADLRIGQHSEGFTILPNPFGGVMDELVILSRVMNADEIKRMHQRGNPAQPY